MFKNVVRYLRSLKERKMPNLRYFINDYPDYNAKSDGIPDMPREELKLKVNEIIKRIVHKLQPIEKNASEGVYQGTAGISYMFYTLSKNAMFQESQNNLLGEAAKYLKPAITVATYNTRHPSDLPSFILGNSGIYAVSAAIYEALGDTNQSKLFVQLYHEAGRVCKEPKFLNCGCDELFVGRAGYILGALWLSKETKTELKLADLSEICSMMVASGREYSKQLKSICPLMYSYYQMEYIGAAHGLSSILQALMSVPGYLNAHPDVKDDVRNCVDYVLGMQTLEGNFPAATDEVGMGRENSGLGSDLVHWCHGAPGVVYMMAKAYLTFNDIKYLNSCKLMSDLIWNKGMLKKGPGICHGVAGNGYVFLLLYRLTANLKYLHRANCFCRFMDTERFKTEARIPDYPYSLYEGLAGTACYLADLANPTEAQFPFSDVFLLMA
ncbi:unnamed protein product [Brassicogethes aeneus]|uniref:LanC-like protein 3 homolog n=1 Tax=Brassicogethes aeneus TaxID=1431903 RepID=A0A9P0AWR4_BRAAE|nr:unnamed protein product [Brassicogethes aeneus]